MANLMRDPTSIRLIRRVANAGEAVERAKTALRAMPVGEYPHLDWRRARARIQRLEHIQSGWARAFGRHLRLLDEQEQRDLDRPLANALPLPLPGCPSCSSDPLLLCKHVLEAEFSASSIAALT